MPKQRWGCIYKLTNTVNGKLYIGKSLNFRMRRSQHKNSWKPGRPKTYLSRAIKKYGWENFKVEILISDVPAEDLSNLEKSYIEVEESFDKGYNLTKGGDGTLGHIPSKETREKKRITSTRYQSKRKQFGTITLVKAYSMERYVVKGPRPLRKHIGKYLTKRKAQKALKVFHETGEKIKSDYKKRKGSLRKRKNAYEISYGGKYVGRYKIKQEAKDALKKYIALNQHYK